MSSRTRTVTFKKLVGMQNARLTEMKLMSSRIKEKSRESLNSNIIKVRIESIREIWSEARKAHSEIIDKDESETDNYITGNVFASLQVTYEDTLDYLLTLSAEFEKESAPIRSIQNLQEQNLRPAKLPKLDLPTFAGRYEDWESFADLFTSLVHNAPHVDDSTKLHYLKSCLAGPAADLVKDVSITSANYASTWQALKARFYNPRLTVFNHINALLNLPYLKREAAAEMRTFADEAQRIVRALDNLKMPVAQWDIWFVHILTLRLDTESRKLWESELSAKDRALISTITTDDTDPHLSRFPTFAELANFLEKRAYALSMISCSSVDSKAVKKTPNNNKIHSASRRIFHANPSLSYKRDTPKCLLCSGLHFIGRCPEFLGKSPYDRRSDVRHLRLCYNCLGRHKFKECTSTNRCNNCKGKHHTLIHLNATVPSPVTNGKAERPFNNDQNEAGAGINIHTANFSLSKHAVLLATAQVCVVGPQGAHTRVRALLDQGSEGSFVSESITQLLGLPKQRVEVPLSVVGGRIAASARAKASFTLRSVANPNFELGVEALVLPRLTSQLPARNLIELDITEFSRLSLADPGFHVPDSVDLILGADIYSQLLRPGMQRFPTSKLIAQDTALGWILSGPVNNAAARRAEHKPENALRILHLTSREPLNEVLEKFWTLEEVPENRTRLTPEDEACEKLFADTHTRMSDGRYLVRLPLKNDLPDVKMETRRMALGSLDYIHRRFSRDPALALAYREFMADYERLGHMTRIDDVERETNMGWYLPHHAVVNRSKIRVVFDASRRTREHHCLNDYMMSGPPLQRDLPLILLKWRFYKFVFTADIVKMFRQIRVAPTDQDWQRIVWTPSQNDPPADYRLNTVTYGTTCAPFLAIRTLNQLAQDERTRFPLGARCLESETYVDDTFAGANDIKLAIQTRIELIELLKTAGIELDKWAANHPDILPPHVQSAEAASAKLINNGDSIKTLGVHWNASQDEFRFSALKTDTSPQALTKRSVLSNIARLFDPLGWLSPITITAKVLMQDLWINKSDWDADLPDNIRTRWLDYCNSLSILPTLKVDRWLGTSENQSCEIHGFSDASSRAYAAAVYLRISDSKTSFRVTLLTAKTKVAPVKTVSIPNLELCGAALLVKLICHLKNLEFLQKLPLFLWSDSEIVLRWLDKHPCHWRTFVANRVSQIQTQLPDAKWLHVPTKENPADIATRGAKPIDLRDSDLWWHGPEWLSQTSGHWPQTPKARKILHSQTREIEPEILTRFSSLTKLIRVVAYCLRPLNKIRRRKNGLCSLPIHLTPLEQIAARVKIIRIAQLNAFRQELNLLVKEKNVPKCSPLSKLNPMLDKEGILRVGGRLTNADISYERKHPPILPRHSNISLLFVRFAHKITLHGGPTLTSNVLMQYAWILGRRQLVKSVIRNCIRCQRIQPRLAHQLMGNLPASRVTPARPFTTSGVDYAGPFQIRATKGRGHKSYKGYIALFVCFSTRAVHLELVSGLTTAAFISAYRRFVSRRGICRHLYSDNATTFRGADTELRSMFQAASTFFKNAAATLANDGTSWTFIPPTTPHYGGLWEAGVKSAKFHLKRAFGEHALTFEEFSTVLTEIEASLNSRPLCPITSDVEDLNVLTPAHFLIGETSGFIPDEEPPAVPANRLSRFQLMQRIRTQFWKRWSEDYLQHLQERGKWRKATENFTVGRLVALRDERFPPAKWPLGRITEIYPGADGHVRVVSVRTASNTLRRHIARLCPLFTDAETNKSHVTEENFENAK